MAKPAISYDFAPRARPVLRTVRKAGVRQVGDIAPEAKARLYSFRTK